MKKQAQIILMMILVATLSYGQPTEGQTKKERMESAKVGMITNRLDLSTEQAQKFWPVYNEYGKKRDVFKKTMKEMKNKEHKTDADYLKSIDVMLKSREDEVALQREYKDKFLQVISAKQLVELYKAEREFAMMLLHRLEGRKKGQKGGQAQGKPGHKGGPRPPHDF